jgi:hypothetical protein
MLKLIAQSLDFIAGLRTGDKLPNRNWLYRTQRTWQSLLLEWDVAGTGSMMGFSHC